MIHLPASVRVYLCLGRLGKGRQKQKRAPYCPQIQCPAIVRASVKFVLLS
jgi:hypothetical protein